MFALDWLRHPYAITTWPTTRGNTELLVRHPSSVQTIFPLLRLRIEPTYPSLMLIPAVITSGPTTAVPKIGPPPAAPDTQTRAPVVALKATTMPPGALCDMQSRPLTIRRLP